MAKDVKCCASDLCRHFTRPTDEPLKHIREQPTLKFGAATTRDTLTRLIHETDTLVLIELRHSTVTRRNSQSVYRMESRHDLGFRQELALACLVSIVLYPSFEIACVRRAFAFCFFESQMDQDKY